MPGADGANDARFRKLFRRHILGALVDADPELAPVRDGTDDEQLLDRGSEAAVLRRCEHALQQVSKLEIKSANLRANGLQALEGAMKSMVSITELHLDGNSLGAEGARALAGALGGMTAITKLNLSGNELGAEGARALAGALGGMTAITTLDLRGNKLCCMGRPFPISAFRP
jgi:hypothetical protein